jgi:hypothetical protein
MAEILNFDSCAGAWKAIGLDLASWVWQRGDYVLHWRESEVKVQIIHTKGHVILPVCVGEAGLIYRADT